MINTQTSRTIHLGDLENFASVSQRNYNLSSEALAVHRARKKAFGVVNDTHPTKVWIKSYGTALVKPPIGIVTAFAND